MPSPSVPAAAPGLPAVQFRHQFLNGAKPLGVGCSAPFAKDGSERVVIFRREPGKDEATAVFPCEPAPPGMLLCFSWPDGFTKRPREWFDRTCSARSDEYRHLAAFIRASLTAIMVHHRITPAMDETRRLRPILAEQEERAGQAVAFFDCAAALIICEALDKAYGGLPSGQRIIRGKAPGRLAAIYLSGLTYKIPTERVALAFDTSTTEVEQAARRMATLRTKRPDADALFKRMERGLRRWVSDGKP